MTKIYFDNCVFQDLKKEENKALLAKVVNAKSHIIFPFSEAHLFDLHQDKTEKKYEDMKFIESIADSNCYYFTDRTKFSYRTPTEYYSDFEWPDMSNFDEILNSMSGLFMASFQAIPLPSPYLTQGDQLPANMPAGIRKLLTQPSTFYDFATLMFEMTDDLVNDQSTFREHLKYLHVNNLLTDFYKVAGIEGYDGITVTDKKLFWSSFAKKFISEGRAKSRYELFLEMYHCLDVFGFVKGKPKKQRVMNLINDARHSFFGTVCDVIVSKDVDFLEKTKFMYQIEEIGTRIIHLSELDLLLDELEQSAQTTISSLYDEIIRPFSEHTIYHVNQTEIGGEIFVRLKKTYFMYFNLMGYMNDEVGSYRSICKERINHSSGTLVKQIRYIISRLLNELGPDLHQKGELTREEGISDKAEIRSWVLEDLVISLILDEKLYINFYPLRIFAKEMGK